MAEFLVRKNFLRKALCVLVGFGNHCYFILLLIISFWLHYGLFALNLMWVVFLLFASLIHHCRAKTINGWFVLRLPYLYVDAVLNGLLCEPYIRAVFFLMRYLVTPVMFGYLTYDILVNWEDYLSYFGCASEDGCKIVGLLQTIIAGFAMSLFSLLEVPIGCLLIC